MIAADTSLATPITRAPNMAPYGWPTPPSTAAVRIKMMKLPPVP